MIQAVESHDRRRPYRLTATGAAALETYLQAQRTVAEVGLRRLSAGWRRHDRPAARPAACGETGRRQEGPPAAGQTGWSPGIRDPGGSATARSSPSCCAPIRPNAAGPGAATPTSRPRGLRARLASAGLAGHPLDPGAAARAGLVTIAVSLSAAAIAGVAVWARLAIGLQWSAPRTPGPGQDHGPDVGRARADRHGRPAGGRPGGPCGSSGCRTKKARALRLPACLIAGGTGVLVIGGPALPEWVAGHRRASARPSGTGAWAASRPSAGPPPCGSRPTGRTPAPWPRSRPGRSPGCWPARPRPVAWSPGPYCWFAGCR